MLRKMGLGRLFGQKTDHPLADAKDMRRILAELPTDNAFKALDEIIDWFGYLIDNHHFPAERFYEVLVQFEGAAQPHLQRLSREYLQSTRLSRAEERRLWSIHHGFWTMLALSYERCLKVALAVERPSEALRQSLPALCVRLINALGGVLKWERFQYASGSNELWGRLGWVVLQAVNGKFAEQPVLVGRGKPSSVEQEFKKVMIFQSAALDAMRPLDMELAEIFLGHFLGSFYYTGKAVHDCIYWTDLAIAYRPQRLAIFPAKAEVSQRFFKAGDAYGLMQQMLRGLERGGKLPEELPLAGLQCTPVMLIGVLRHLLTYFSPTPPLRQYDRHRVMHKMSLLDGLPEILKGLFAPPEKRELDSWFVENVSRGGFGALLKSNASDPPRIGGLLAMQPEGGENWLLGIIRRCRRDSDGELRVGIEILARQVIAVGLRSCNTPNYAVVAKSHGLLLRDGNAEGEVRLILQQAGFAPRDTLEYALDGQKFLLSPLLLVEQSPDYVLARYRQSLLT